MMKAGRRGATVRASGPLTRGWRRRLPRPHPRPLRDPRTPRGRRSPLGPGRRPPPASGGPAHGSPHHPAVAFPSTPLSALHPRSAFEFLANVIPQNKRTIELLVGQCLGPLRAVGLGTPPAAALPNRPHARHPPPQPPVHRCRPPGLVWPATPGKPYGPAFPNLQPALFEVMKCICGTGTVCIFQSTGWCSG